jgi:hypothetical protein
MNLDTKLKLVAAGWFLLPVVVPLLLIRVLPRPKSLGWRATVAALLASVLWILYTTDLYYPLYHMASWQRGENPNISFDSDRLNGVRYFLAWVVPECVVLVAVIWCMARQRLMRSALNAHISAQGSVIGDF